MDDEVSLAERRCRLKWSQDPRNTFWSSDKSKFGYRMLQKMGWSDGKGLGVNEDGTKEHIKISKKDNTLGVGAKKSRDDDWIEQQLSFDALLADLNQDGGTTEHETVGHFTATAEKSKKLLYHKFLRSKDLSRKANEDINCVFGKRKRKRESDKQEPNSETSSNSEFDNYSGIPTVKSNLSLAAYFSQKTTSLAMDSPESTLKKKKQTQKKCN